MPTVLRDFSSSDAYSDYSKSDKISTFGGEDDTFGAELTLENLKDPNFSVKFDANVGAGTLRVDQVAIEVFYELPMLNTSLLELPPWAEEELQAGAVCRGSDGLKYYVVVGKNGLMKKSRDGATWTDVESGTAATLRAVKATKNGVVAVGDNGTVVQSADLVNFTRQDSGTGQSLNSVVYDLKSGAILTAGLDGVVSKQNDNSATWALVRA